MITNSSGNVRTYYSLLESLRSRDVILSLFFYLTIMAGTFQNMVIQYYFTPHTMYSSVDKKDEKD